MRCDEFLPAIATGGVVRRRLARRHTATCPACAAALAGYEAMTRRLADAPPLSARERRLWTRAADGSEARLPARRWVGWRLPVTAGLAVAAGVVVVLIVLAGRPDSTPAFVKGDPTATPTTNVGGEPPGRVTANQAVAVDPAAEMSRLSAGADRLEAELLRLRRKAERASARREVAMVLDRFDRR